MEDLKFEEEILKKKKTNSYLILQFCASLKGPFEQKHQPDAITFKKIPNPGEGEGEVAQSCRRELNGAADYRMALACPDLSNIF